MPPVGEWDTWPFSGDLSPRPLLPPVAAEGPRHGAGGIGCASCGLGAAGTLWTDDRWRVRPTDGPTGLPVILLLETNEHVDFLDLSDDLASELGPMLLKVQRAIFAVGEIGNVRVCRWGDGSEHLHVWFMARPARVPQLIGSFAAIWDDVLPPLPDDVWQAKLAVVRAGLNT